LTPQNTIQNILCGLPATRTFVMRPHVSLSSDEMSSYISNKIEISVYREVLHGHQQGVLDFANITRFHCQCVYILSLRPVRKVRASPWRYWRHYHILNSIMHR